MNGSQFEKTDNGNKEENKDNLELAKRKEIVDKFIEQYASFDRDDWEGILLNKSEENPHLKNIEQARTQDMENIESYKNGQLLKLKIFNTYFGAINRFLIIKKLEDDRYEALQASGKWNTGSEFARFTEDTLKHHVNLRYDLIEKVLNTRVKPLLIDSAFKNSKDELITIRDIDFNSGEIQIEHNGQKISRNYYEAIETSAPLQKHISSIIAKNS